MVFSGLFLEDIGINNLILIHVNYWNFKKSEILKNSSYAVHMVSFENFVKSMPPTLSELKVTPSFCFAFKIPDDVTASKLYSNFSKEIIQSPVDFVAIFELVFLGNIVFVHYLKDNHYIIKLYVSNISHAPFLSCHEVIRWSTCTNLICFTWLLNHVIYLKLRRRNCYQSRINLTNGNFFLLKMTIFNHCEWKQLTTVSDKSCDLRANSRILDEMQTT